MRRLEDIERRLLNWARWKSGAGAGVGNLGYASVNLADADAGRSGYIEAPVPTSACEAEETDRAVLALESPMRAAVEWHYLQPGTYELKAGRLCCSVATFKNRVTQAHHSISRWLSDLHQARQLQRERLERLQASARPKGDAHF